MVAAPTVEGIRFAYALHPLPPGRLPLERWRFELWHGPRLVAAGWRVSRADASRALRRHAARVAHELFGLTAPPPDAPGARGDLRPGTVERLAIGAVSCLLVPRGLDEQPAALVATS